MSLLGSRAEKKKEKMVSWSSVYAERHPHRQIKYNYRDTYTGLWAHSRRTDKLPDAIRKDLTEVLASVINPETGYNICHQRRIGKTSPT